MSASASSGNSLLKICSPQRRTSVRNKDAARRRRRMPVVVRAVCCEATADCTSKEEAEVTKKVLLPELAPLENPPGLPGATADWTSKEEAEVMKKVLLPELAPLEDPPGLPGATADCTSKEEAEVMKKVRELKNFPPELAPLENPRGLPAATTGRRRGGLLLEKGKAAVAEDVLEGENPPMEAVLLEGPRGLPAATAGWVDGLSSLEKGQGVVVEEELMESLHVSTQNQKELVVGAPRRRRSVATRLQSGKNYMTDARLVDILLLMNGSGGPLPPQIHWADVYSKHPKELVKEFPWSALMINGKGAEHRVWLFIWEKPHGRCIGGRSSQKWYGDGGTKKVEDANREIISGAFKKTFYHKINCVPKQSDGQRTGWAMVEYWLANQQKGTLRICVVHQCNRTYPETPTTDNSSPGTETPSFEHGQDELLGSQGADRDIASPSICCANFTELLVQPAEKATSCDDYKMPCEIKEFVIVKDQLGRKIADLGLHMSLLSEPWDKLKVLHRNAAITKELTSKARDEIASCCERMENLVQSALSDKMTKREWQENNALRRSSANVDQFTQQASQAIDVQMLVPAENGNLSNVECPTPVNTSAASSSGVKRKVDQAHPEAPPRTRQERVPTPAGVDCVVTIGVPKVQTEQHELAEVAEGGSEPGNAMDDPEAPPSTNQERAVTENRLMTLETDVFMDFPSSAFEIQLEQQPRAPGRTGPENNVVDTMEAGGDNGRDPEGSWAECATGSLTEVDAEQGSWEGPDITEVTEHQLSPGNDLSVAVADYGCQFDIDEYLRSPLNFNGARY